MSICLLCHSKISHIKCQTTSLVTWFNTISIMAQSQLYPNKSESITGYIQYIRYVGEDTIVIKINTDDREFETYIAGLRESLNSAFYSHKQVTLYFQPKWQKGVFREFSVSW